MAIKRCIISEKSEGERGAENLVREARRYDGEISISKNNRIANAKSMIGILGLELKSGDEVVVDVYEDIPNDTYVLNSFLETAI